MVPLHDDGLQNATSTSGEIGHKEVRKVRFAILPVLFSLLNFALCTALLCSDRIRCDGITHKKLTKMICTLVFAALACLAMTTARKRQANVSLCHDIMIFSVQKLKLVSGEE